MVLLFSGVTSKVAGNNSCNPQKEQIEVRKECVFLPAGNPVICCSDPKQLDAVLELLANATTTLWDLPAVLSSKEAFTKAQKATNKLRDKFQYMVAEAEKKDGKHDV